MDKYQQMKLAGASARQVAVELRQGGKGFGEIIRTVRALYGLSLGEAKKIYVTSDGTDWDEYQDRLADALERAIQLEDDEHNFPGAEAPG